MIHSEPDDDYKLILYTNQNPISSLLSKSSEADFCVSLFYHTLSGMINSYCGSGKFCRIHTFGKKCIEFGKFCRTNSADFAYSFYIFCRFAYYKFYMYRTHHLALKIYVKYILIYMYFILILYLLL